MALPRTWLSACDIELARLVGPVIRVLQFNILANSLADGSTDEPLANPAQHLCESRTAGCHYHYRSETPVHTFRTSKRHLDWEQRRPKILEIITQEKPDIICLQEVDCYQDIAMVLEAAGYQGAFCKKAWKKILDGSAVFWSQALRCKDVHRIQLQPNNAMTALILRLESSEGVPLIVCSTHLKAGFSAEMEEQRLRQAVTLEHHLTKLASDAAATIIAADLNAHYADYALCTTRGCCDLAARVEPKAISFLCQAGFQPAYPEFPSFTAWSGWLDRDVKASLDHILYRGPIKPKAVLEIPPEELICQWPELLPNSSWPSDHLHLMADFVLL